MPENFIIRENPEYTQQLKALAEAEGLELKHFSKALNITFHILSRDPRAYPMVIMNISELRVAKTEMYVDDFTVPPLRIYYRIRDDENVVELLKIEKRRGFGL